MQASCYLVFPLYHLAYELLLVWRATGKPHGIHLVLHLTIIVLCGQRKACILYVTHYNYVLVFSLCYTVEIALRLETLPIVIILRLLSILSYCSQNYASITYPSLNLTVVSDNNYTYVATSN